MWSFDKEENNLDRNMAFQTLLFWAAFMHYSVLSLRNKLLSQFKLYTHAGGIL